MRGQLNSCPLERRTMSDNVTPFPSAENSIIVSLDNYVNNITEAVKEKKVKSILTIVYEYGDEDPILYLAGEYVKTREILGDLRFIEDFVLNEY